MNNSFEQLTIPLAKDLLDYKRTMYNAVCKIASFEGKTVQQQLLSFLHPDADILRIRLGRKDGDCGSIPFDDAINLYENAKKLLAATVLDVINPQKTHSGTLDDSVQQFLSQCRFGQTESDGYTVPVVCPFADISKAEGYEKLSIISSEEQCAHSLTRKVVNKVMTNIASIKEKVHNDDLDSLVDGTDSISSNFYEALSSLIPNLADATLEFTAAWSPIVRENRCPIEKVPISHDYYAPLQSVISRINGSAMNKTRIIGGSESKFFFARM